MARSRTRSSTSSTRSSAGCSGSTFRHGRVIGSPMGEPAHAYYAEWEFADDESFKAATRSAEFMATGKDAFKRGFPQPTVEFVAF